MATQITTYQCPACTGPLHFVGETGKLQCDFCDSTYEVSEIEKLYAQKEQQAQEAFQSAQEQSYGEEPDWDTSRLSEDWGDDAGAMRAYNCPSCGAELVCEATTAATSCPYCGNPTVVPGQFGGTLKPDYIIPFKLDKEAAMTALKNHYKGKIFLPKAFRKENHMQEMQGLYVPFWLFDAEAEADCLFHATRSHSHRQGDYRITTTEHYQARRSGTVSFSRIPADGSKKMPDDYMDSIEPFDYEELKAFSTAYLPGFLADKYDVSAAECAQRADKRCENSAIDVMRSDVTGYATVTTENANVRLRRGQVQYALLPVWTLLTKWRGKDYLFMMNGQTGKLVGDLPVDKGKFWGLLAGLTVALGALIFFTGIGASLASSLLG